uniref:Uncharacterized protein n=1 Tax=Arthrobacter sp. JBH1 TaxID=723551 RepID=I1Y9G9_9MICC|nr:hypothetical protein [Arthrobacter sp. JBH1]
MQISPVDRDRPERATSPETEGAPQSRARQGNIDLIRPPTNDRRPTTDDRRR